MNVVLATTNTHKADEMRPLLQEYGIGVVNRPAGLADVDETADTLEGNALLKARAVSDALGEVALADDTGLFVDALDGRPGVVSARYAGLGATAEENVEKLLAELVDVDARDARFRTVVAVSFPDGRSWWVDGVLEGDILRAPRGDDGFGYDAVFAPRVLGGRSLGEVTISEKAAMSHRTIALRAIVATLANK